MKKGWGSLACSAKFWGDLIVAVIQAFFAAFIQFIKRAYKKTGNDFLDCLIVIEQKF